MVKGRKLNAVQRQEMAQMRAHGLSDSEIGRRMRVSRQYVYSALKALSKGPLSVPCSACGQAIVSAAAMARDAKVALCLDCLASRPHTPFATRLQSLRLAAGMTKVELSRKASVSEDTLVSYETGTTAPKPRMLDKLVTVLGEKLAPPEAKEPRRA